MAHFPRSGAEGGVMSRKWNWTAEPVTIRNCIATSLPEPAIRTAFDKWIERFPDGALATIQNNAKELAAELRERELMMRLIDE